MREAINLSRKLLINIGKMLPFILCMAVCVSYIESLHSILGQHYVVWGDEAYLSKPVSFFIGKYLNYNIQMLVLVFIISISVRTCYYNKLACGYLLINTFQKHIFEENAYDVETCCVVCFVNIYACWWLVKNGVSTYFKAS